MSDVGSRLADALGDCYRIERRLGQGGMATVYLAAERAGLPSGPGDLQFRIWMKRPESVTT